MRHDGEVDRFRIFVGDYLQRSERNIDEYEATRRELEDEATLAVRPTSEMASEIIYAQQTGTPHELYVNVRNDGLISNLPQDCCVEVPAIVDRDGVHPQAVGTLPPHLAALNRTFLNVAELTVRAVLEGDREHVYHAALLDPNTSATLTMRQTRELCDELLRAHGDLIPAALRP